MRLISNNRDYYDSLFFKYSTEQKPVWVRKEKDINLFDSSELLTKDQRELLIALSNFTCHRPYYGDGTKTENKYCRFIVGFCGKVIPITLLIKDGIKTPYDNMSDVIDIIINDKHFKDIRHNIKSDSYFSYYGDMVYGLSVKAEANWYTLYSGINKVYDIFISLNTPIFIISCGFKFYGHNNSNRVLTINPILKDINFQKIKPPFVAFQEIEQFLTNNLVNDPVIPEFSDTIKRDYHGFDNMSFKNRGKNGK